MCREGVNFFEEKHTRARERRHLAADRPPEDNSAWTCEEYGRRWAKEYS